MQPRINKKGFVISRSEGYLGVLSSDLTKEDLSNPTECLHQEQNTESC